MNTTAYDMVKELQILAHTILFPDSGNFKNNPANRHLFTFLGKQSGNTLWKVRSGH